MSDELDERIAELEADRDHWREQFNSLFDRVTAEYKRHRASPLASGGNVHILQVRVPEKLFKRVNRYRIQRDLSVSAAARDLIEDALDRATKENNP